jgi:dipeptidase
VASEVRERGAISNLLTISEWDLSSPSVREHAEAQGWWRPEGGFAAAYQDPETDLTTRTCRLERAREILGGYQPGIGVPDMMAVLRDHGDRDLPNGPEPLPTICMHANPAFEGETAAGMVVNIRPDQPKLLTATVWTAFGSPCLSLFRPVYPFAVGLPDRLAIAGASYDPDSPWWVFERLQRVVARAPSSAGMVRDAFRPMQESFFAEAALAETRAAELLASGDEPAAAATLRALVDSTTERATALANQLTLALLEDQTHPPIAALSAFWDEPNATVSMAASGPADMAAALVH